ncbi:MAG: tRNA guanosine(34) transglycosylase Tgt [Planctomycetota bacterium]
MSVGFVLEHEDRQSGARAGVLTTAHGEVPTPAFMPVGTQGAVKAMIPPLVVESGSRMILANTYHLALRPGAEDVAALGGLHRFMGWDGPILTDSGGFQVFSLAQLSTVTEGGVRFRSHVDGAELFLSPERAIEVQQMLGSDVMMVLDECVPYPCERDRAERAMERTLDWAGACLGARTADQGLFAIVQGSTYPELRRKCAQKLAQMPFDGYAIGGVSVGEGPLLMDEAVACTVPELPAGKPRYLMGVGPPDDLLRAIGQGVDLFDCVMPTRNARGACAFTWQGKVRLRNAEHARSQRPIDQACGCRACRTVSRGALRHLFQAGEMAAAIWVTLHNLTFYQDLMRRARQAIRNDTFDEFKADTLAREGG